MFKFSKLDCLEPSLSIWSYVSAHELEYFSVTLSHSLKSYVTTTIPWNICTLLSYTTTSTWKNYGVCISWSGRAWSFLIKSLLVYIYTCKLSKIVHVFDTSSHGKYIQPPWLEKEVVTYDLPVNGCDEGSNTHTPLYTFHVNHKMIIRSCSTACKIDLPNSFSKHRKAT